MEFTDTVTTLEDLRRYIAPPHEVVTGKDMTALDDQCRDFIGRSPFIVVASADGRGHVDTSPKGDPPGFVQVLDDTTIAIPERPGNHRAETLTNIVQQPFVGVIFLIPGTKFTLRVRGRAVIVRDTELRQSMAVQGKVPELAIVVHVDVAYFHCAKCIIRSKLWAEVAQPTVQPDDRLLAESMVRHGELPFTVDEMQEIIEDDEENRLY